jgi:hypothetical protein
MPINHTNLLSGRALVVDYGNLSADRNQFLALGEAEPNLGPGAANAVLTLGTNNARVFTNALSLTSVVATGNVTGGNILTDGNVSALGNVTGTYFLGNGSQLTGLTATTGNITFSNTTISTNIFDANIILAPTGNGVVAIANIDGGATGIQLGSNTAGQLVSNALILTTATSVTNSIAELNQVLGKLVPIAPLNFPAAQSLAITGLSTYRMANITQINNTANSLTVSAGATVTNIIRAATYATNTIATAGPGDSGTITAYRNNTGVGNVTLNAAATPSANGTYGGNLVISSNQDYHSSNAAIAPGFWYVFSAAISGSSAPGGWNDVTIVDTAAGATNVPSWYYDNSAPGTPGFTSLSITAPGSPTLTYSSTVPHYTNTNVFTIGFNANRLSGNTYPVSDTFVTGSAGGAFGAPGSVTYQSSSLGTNILPANANATVSTTSTIVSGFGSSSTGPSVSVNNSFATGTQAFTGTLANIVQYKTGNVSSLTFLDEGNIFIGSTIGSGSGTAFRIVNPGSSNTPVYTGSEAAFNSQTGPLQTYDSTVVANVLKHDQTNYATGYLPAGPNLSVGRGAAQYFTFKFVRTSTSKFDIKLTGTIGGLWVALPGSVFDTFDGVNGPTSTLNGWLNMAIPYGGSGIPGADTGVGGNGSDGCSLGGAVPLNTPITATGYTCTFGTVSSTSTATNEIYVRIRLTAGQSVTSLSLQTASN